MSKAIIIRLYHNNEADQRWRYHYFASCVLPRLQAQTINDFDICILSPPHWHERLKELDSRIKPFTIDGFQMATHGNFTYDMTEGLDKYELQVRLDSDDLVSPDFMEIIDRTEGNVSFQPELFLLDKLRVKRMNHRYGPDKPSCFLAVKGYEECIYHKVFLRFNATLIPEGHAFVTIHDRNRGTTECS